MAAWKVLLGIIGIWMGATCVGQQNAGCALCFYEVWLVTLKCLNIELNDDRILVSVLNGPFLVHWDNYCFEPICVQMTYKHLTSINVADVFCRSRTERGRENRIRCTSRQSTKTSLNNTPSKEKTCEIPSIAAFVEVIILPSQGKLCFFWGVGEGEGKWNENSLTMAGWSWFFLVVVSNIFYVHPYLGKISNLTTIFQMSWNRQPVLVGAYMSCQPMVCSS